MKKVENGDYVSVDYTGTLQNGEVFDTSEGREPLEVKMGAGQLIQGFESELMGMELNEKKTFTVEPEDAYGNKNEDAVQTFARADLPPEMDPKVGDMVGLTTPDGQQIPAQIAVVDDEKITVDLNHPLAGEALTFQIEVVGISDAPTQAAGGCDCSGGSCQGC